jgi:predicted transposase/invertase (TIGR01784 family)
LLGINILELNKLPKVADGTSLWYWGTFFKSEKEEEFAMVAEKEPGVKKAVGVLSEDQRNEMLQDARDRWLTDHQNALNYKYRLGLEKGQQAEKLEIARKMKQSAMPLAQITELTGLSPEEIEKRKSVMTDDEVVTNSASEKHLLMTSSNL